MCTSGADMAEQIWCMNFRGDASVDRERCGIHELGEDSQHLNIVASKRAQQLDFLQSQYDDVIISERAARCLRRAKLSNFELRPQVQLLSKGKRSPGRWWALLPRGFAGAVHPSSGASIVRYRDGDFEFRTPADPRWKSDPAFYANAGDVFRLYPFTERIFVSDRFRRCIDENRLTGVVLLPFGNKEPRSGSGFMHVRYGRFWRSRLPSWLADWQVAALWAQFRALAAPDTLPPDMPDSLRASVAPPKPKRNTLPPSPWADGWKRTRLDQFERLADKLIRDALAYAKAELASADAEDWRASDLVWDGDRLKDSVAARRWRLKAVSTPLWIIAELRGRTVDLAYFE